MVVVDADYSAIETMAERWRDNDMPLHLAKELGLPAKSLPLRIEGGNILCNGEGVGVTSVTVAVRNLERGLEIREIGVLMGRTLGISKWCYLPPLEGEPTGHVDIYLTFLAPDLAVVAECDPGVDPVNARRLDDAARVLESMDTSLGPMRVRRVPILRAEDDSWRSFNNVIITDRKLLVPVFADVDPAVQERVLVSIRSWRRGARWFRSGPTSWWRPAGRCTASRSRCRPMFPWASAWGRDQDATWSD